MLWNLGKLEMHLVESLRYNFNKFLRRSKNSRIWAKYGDATRSHFLDDSRIIIGDYTYGVPTIYRYDKQVKLSIGKYCSIAKGVEILLGGCHHTDWCSTYPFYSKIQMPKGIRIANVTILLLVMMFGLARMLLYFRRSEHWKWSCYWCW